MTAPSLREAVARALWRKDCERSDAEERRAGRTPPEKWADPWHPSGCGVRQQKGYLEDADAVLAVALPRLREHYAKLAELADAVSGSVYLSAAAATIRADEGPA